MQPPTMYAIAAYTNMVQFKKVVVQITQETYPGREAGTNFGLGGLRIAFEEWISSQLTKNREPPLSLGCPHPSRRNQVPAGDNATAALILFTMEIDMGVPSAWNSRSSESQTNERGESRGRKKLAGKARMYIPSILYTPRPGYQRSTAVGTNLACTMLGCSVEDNFPFIGSPIQLET